MGEYVMIAMEPVTDSDGELDVFNITRNDRGQLLQTEEGDPDNVLRQDERWIFTTEE